MAGEHDSHARPIKEIKDDGTLVLMTRDEEIEWRKSLKQKRREKACAEPDALGRKEK